MINFIVIGIVSLSIITFFISLEKFKVNRIIKIMNNDMKEALLFKKLTEHRLNLKNVLDENLLEDFPCTEKVLRSSKNLLDEIGIDMEANELFMSFYKSSSRIFTEKDFLSVYKIIAERSRLPEELKEISKSDSELFTQMFKLKNHKLYFKSKINVFKQLFYFYFRLKKANKNKLKEKNKDRLKESLKSFNLYDNFGCC